MSDLVILFSHVENPPPACVEEPPTDGTEDGCHLSVGIQEVGAPAGEVRQIQFNRSGDQFVMAPSTHPEVRAWFESHENTTQIHNVLRMTGNLLRTGEESTVERATMFATISHYLVTGEVRLPGTESQVEDPVHIGDGFLYILADSGENLLSRILGRLQISRRAAWVEENPSIRDRIRWVNSILDVVPQYHDFRRHFLSPEDLRLYLTPENARSDWDHRQQERFRKINAVVRMARELVISETLTRPLRFTGATYRAMNAYQQLYEGQINNGQRGSFCEVIREALPRLTNRDVSSQPILQDCELLDLAGEAPLTDLPAWILNRTVMGPTGRRELQQAIEEESADADMPIDWFFPEDGVARRSFAHVSQSFWENTNIHGPTGPEDTLRVTFDFNDFRQSLDLDISVNTTTRREYILLGIAYLRRFFGNEGELPTFRTFQNNRMTDWQFDINETELRDIRRYIRSLERQLGSSHDFSDTTLPILESIACGVGIAGVAVAEAVPEIRNDDTLHLGVGTPSAALAGGGCTSLLMHYAGQPLLGYRNRPMVEGITGGVGFLAGGGVYLLINLLGGGGSNPPMPGGDERFPVDSYGP